MACVNCKVDFIPREVDEVNNKAYCKNCKKEIKIVKATVKLDSEEFTFE